MKQILIIFFIFTTLFIQGCSSSEDNSNESGSFQVISGKDAHNMISENSDFIILDVRTEEEYNEGHIPDSILIPYTELEEKASSLLPDKSATILVYCRSGRRSNIAAETLFDLGYKNIYDFGGIIDWEYETVK